MRVAIVHDWLTVYGGAERVLEELIHCFPEADVFTTLDCLPDEQRGFLHGRPVHTSFLQRIPCVGSVYRRLLPLMPMAVERMDLRDYDLVISNSFAIAKGVLTTPDQLHISYLQARNMKYAYEDRFIYPGCGPVKFIEDWLLSKLRLWDSVASRRPDVTVANSHYVRRWHMRRHHIDCQVIYPPVDVARFRFVEGIEPENYYVTTSRLEPYKRIDLIVQACTALNAQLVVIGSGTEAERLKSMAGPTVQFLGYQKPDVVEEVTSRAKAFVFASREDFGIAPLEAQACGTPVIALGQGGTLETIVGLNNDHPTGVFFREQTVESVMKGMRSFEVVRHRINRADCRRQATRFSRQSFQRNFKNFTHTILLEQGNVQQLAALLEENLSDAVICDCPG